MMRFYAIAATALSVFCSGVFAQSPQDQFNDYPTAARADYVFACMAVNGQGRDVLEQCACSIDVLASIIPYKDYVEAETVLSMALVGGEKMAIFRSDVKGQTQVADLRRAQAEAEILCF